MTGKIDRNTQFDKNDFRNTVPCFSPEAREPNKALVEVIAKFAERKGATPEQIALGVAMLVEQWFAEFLLEVIDSFRGWMFFAIAPKPVRLFFALPIFSRNHGKATS